jgi:hypothetical protein
MLRELPSLPMTHGRLMEGMVQALKVPCCFPRDVAPNPAPQSPVTYGQRGMFSRDTGPTATPSPLPTAARDPAISPEPVTYGQLWEGAA